MSFANEASKLFTNKYFLYFMLFLSSANILGYLVTNKFNAVVFFGLVSLLTYQFSKNMSVVLLVSIISTNFLMSNKKIREGLENQTNALNKIEDKDQQIADAINAVKDSQTNEQVKEKLNNKSTDTDITKPPVDVNNSDLNTSNETGPVGVGEKVTGMKNNKTNSRVDYAATIEESYANLDKILGGDAINKLSGDTQKLMAQQQKLFDTMQNMVPVLNGAQNLLKGFNINGLADSLKNVSGLANAQMPITNK